VASDNIDTAVGMDRVLAVGERVEAGSSLLRLCLRSGDQIEWARARAQAAFTIAAAAAPVPVVVDRVEPGARR
jgi:thymidine phosphorylase